jgi:hypothetical protein
MHLVSCIVLDAWWWWLNPGPRVHLPLWASDVISAKDPHRTSALQISQSHPNLLQRQDHEDTEIKHYFDEERNTFQDQISFIKSREKSA